MPNLPTPPAIEVGDAWVDLYAASGLTVGTQVLVNNRGQQSIFLAESLAAPSIYLLGVELYPTRQLIVDEDSVGLWARSVKSSRTSYAIVQVDNNV